VGRSRMIMNDDIYDLPIKFDIARLKEAYHRLKEQIGYSEGLIHCMSLNTPAETETNIQRGIFWIRQNDGAEETREERVDEKIYTELIPEIKNTYFEEVYNKLSEFFVLGRVRVLCLEPRRSLSYHRDPEPRVHLPIISNPGALAIVENFCTYLPANGSLYWMETTKYHSAMNGSEEARVHLVATILDIKKRIMR